MVARAPQAAHHRHLRPSRRCHPAGCRRAGGRRHRRGDGLQDRAAAPAGRGGRRRGWRHAGHAPGRGCGSRTATAARQRGAADQQLTDCVRIQDQALRAFRQSRGDIRQAGHPQCVRISAPRTRAANPSPDARSAPSSRPACVRAGVIRRRTLARRTLAMQNVSTPIGVE